MTIQVNAATQSLPFQFYAQRVKFNLRILQVYTCLDSLIFLSSGLLLPSGTPQPKGSLSLASHFSLLNYSNNVEVFMYHSSLLPVSMCVHACISVPPILFYLATIVFILASLYMLLTNRSLEVESYVEMSGEYLEVFYYLKKNVLSLLNVIMVSI